MKDKKVVDFNTFKSNKEKKENDLEHLDGVDVDLIRKELRSKLREEKRKELLSKN